MTKAKRTQIGFVVFAIFYFSLSNFTWHIQQREIFPFYSWDLFSYIPSYTREFNIILIMADGQNLETPLYFNEAKAYLPDANSIEAFALIQAIGRSYEGQDQATLNAQRHQFESLYFNHLSSAHYELVIREFDPLILKQSGEIDNLTYLATFAVD